MHPGEEAKKLRRYCSHLTNPPCIFEHAGKEGPPEEQAVCTVAEKQRDALIADCRKELPKKKRLKLKTGLSITADEKGQPADTFEVESYFPNLHVEEGTHPMLRPGRSQKSSHEF
jgi:hypothetical protein